MSVSEPEEVGINYTIPAGLHARAKAAASLKGQTLKAWVIRAIQAAVDDQEAERERQRRPRR